MLSPMMETFLDKTIQMLQNENLKKKIEILVLQPIMQYMIELLFPYVIIVCVVFGVLIIMLTSVLYLLIMQMSPIIYTPFPTGPSFASFPAASVPAVWWIIWYLDGVKYPESGGYD